MPHVEDDKKVGVTGVSDSSSNSETNKKKLTNQEKFEKFHQANYLHLPKV